MEQSLIEIWKTLAAQGFESDKNSVHSYGPVYEEILAPYRHTAKNILEIGLFHGHSLRLWESYFSGEVHGIDCSETPIEGMADLRPMINSGKHNIHILDATSEEAIEKEFGGMKFSVVFDDGSHLTEHQMQTINIFKNRLTDDGIIIIEDIQDIAKDQWLYYALDSSLTHEIIDLRGNKNRYDDVLILIRKK